MFHLRKISVHKYFLYRIINAVVKKLKNDRMVEKQKNEAVDTLKYSTVFVFIHAFLIIWLKNKLHQE